MALFSLLLAILIERFKLLPSSLHFGPLMDRYRKQFWDEQSLNSEAGVVFAILLPAVVVFIITLLIDGLLLDSLNLLFWCLTAAVCFSHQAIREIFKKYIQAACRGDVQACYHYATELDFSEQLNVVDEQQLGNRVGQTAAWLNYRFYGAVALYFISFGPVGMVFYCSARYFYDYKLKHQADMPLVDHVMTIADWLPSRIFSFGYLLSGQFSSGIAVWSKLVPNIHATAKTIITETATASESLAEVQATPLSAQSTFALLALTQRNFILFLIIVSLLTIFGIIH